MILSTFSNAGHLNNFHNNCLKRLPIIFQFIVFLLISRSSLYFQYQSFIGYISLQISHYLAYLFTQFIIMYKWKFQNLIYSNSLFAFYGLYFFPYLRYLYTEAIRTVSCIILYGFVVYLFNPEQTCFPEVMYIFIFVPTESKSICYSVCSPVMLFYFSVQNCYKKVLYSVTPYF